MSSVDHKVCTRCGLEKPFSDFYRATVGTTPDGFRSRCKACVISRSDPEFTKKMRQYQSEWRAANREKSREHQRRWKGSA
jgi:hypothetical protein